jgi:hypothetical protein
LPRSFSASEDEDAEHADQQILDIRVIVHDDGDHSNPRKKRDGFPNDVPSIQKQLPGCIQTPIINLRALVSDVALELHMHAPCCCRPW